MLTIDNVLKPIAFNIKVKTRNGCMNDGSCCTVAEHLHILLDKGSFSGCERSAMGKARKDKSLYPGTR